MPKDSHADSLYLKNILFKKIPGHPAKLCQDHAYYLFGAPENHWVKHCALAEIKNIAGVLQAQD